MQISLPNLQLKTGSRGEFYVQPLKTMKEYHLRLTSFQDLSVLIPPLARITWDSVLATLAVSWI